MLHARVTLLPNSVVLVWLTTVCFSFYFITIVIGDNCFTSKEGLSVVIVETHVRKVALVLAIWVNIILMWLVLF